MPNCDRIGPEWGARIFSVIAAQRRAGAIRICGRMRKSFVHCPLMEIISDLPPCFHRPGQAATLPGVERVTCKSSLCPQLKSGDLYFTADTCRIP